MDSSSDYLRLPINQLVGVHFRPTDQQLLHFLHCKIYRTPFFQGNLFDFDLYGGTEPWDIWQQFDGIDGEDLYFFTKLKRSVTNSGHLSAHINRKIGLANGTWSGENSATPIFVNEDCDQIIGYRKRFRYENVELKEHHGEWIMHEYSLHQDYLTCEDIDPNYVLCRMRKNERTKRKLEKLHELEQPKIKKVNDKPKRKARKICSTQLQQTEQRVTSSEMICNSQPMSNMTTNSDQELYVEPYVPNMSTIQDNNDLLLDTPLMLTNENISFSIGDAPYLSTNNEWMGSLDSSIFEDFNFQPDIQNNFDNNMNVDRFLG